MDIFLEVSAVQDAPVGIIFCAESRQDALGHVPDIAAIVITIRVVIALTVP